jgi:hypothetical protein
MKLSEYIAALQKLQEQYVGLDIRVMQKLRDKHFEGSTTLGEAASPAIYPLVVESMIYCIRDDAILLDPEATPKGSAPDGALVV